MRVTPSHVLAGQMLGRTASVFLTLILVAQPVTVTAKTVANVDTGEVLTAVSDELPGDDGAVHGPEQPPTVQEILLEACEAKGYGEECAKTLLGMMWKESRNVANAIGDGGKARGYFQIHYRLHKVSLDCATDLRCSADWTIRYMERNGYPKRVMYAVQCHNGCGARNGYAASVMRHASRLWHEPMTVAIAAK
jgi:hypothetical protein